MEIDSSNHFPVFEVDACHREKQQWLSTYRGNGLHVFPTYMKFPLIRDWQNVGIGEQLAPRVHDIGALCGIQFEVLDLDSYELVQYFGHISNVVKYGAQGRASYFFKPTIGISMHGAGWDFLSVGTFTVMPPSRHPSGVRYRWFQNYFTVDELEPIDPFILNELQNNYAKSSLSKSSSGGMGRNSSLARYAALLAHDGMKLSDIATELLRYDVITHDIPWFTDPSEKHRACADILAIRIANWAVRSVAKSGVEIVF